MKVVVSRRNLTKLCYKAAILLDLMELNANRCSIYIHLSRLSVVFTGKLDPKNKVHITNLSDRSYAELSIPIVEAIRNNYSGINFTELCEKVTTLRKEVDLIELQVTDGEITIIPLDNVR